MKIAIIDYGAGNVQSVLFALNRLGYTGTLTADADVIRSSDKVIFPGVGEASSAMQKIKESGLDTIIPGLKQPVLGICLGMQLLCRHSEETNTDCLGVFDVDVIRFSNRVKIPQIGWNKIFRLKSELFRGIDENAFVYFVHSYFVPNIPQSVATTFYNSQYASAIQKNNFYGVQFHPEKSGETGDQILKNFLNL